MTMQPTNNQNNNGVPAVPEAEGEGIRPQDLRPPFLVLLQRSGERGQEGNWIRTDTGEAFEAPQVIPLKLWQTRRKWPAGEYSEDRKPECWSHNGRTAAPGSAYEGRDCSKCEFRRDNIFAMSNEEDAKGQACAPTYAAIVLEAFSFEPLLMNLGSKTMYRLASTLETNMRSSIVELTASSFRGDKGQWMSPKGKRVSKLETDDQQAVRDLYVRFSGVQLDTESAPEPAAAASDAQPPEPTYDATPEPQPPEPEQPSQADQAKMREVLDPTRPLAF